mmetsp:Transcript_26368/g.46762  ORF Transcript_26368/g.46762 Transcript_26368/m.46762 type:complete len:218 (-) Transcript_26368:108-761(-)|eukprot:CAMPEP_0197526226 /NCGR_PEP_ID=MMETSP1318-20131121/16827_1 /TAXON_ID=552666 /ORGANISM="Partenskyella glossopodia, Strain RCC365" /LENGTH=217 /DNA_ID=CAMNT_0043080293 /DNA_START=117 /DNA_END=770 /DNA_ORIENTATION=-
MDLSFQAAIVGASGIGKSLLLEAFDYDGKSRFRAEEAGTTENHHAVKELILKEKMIRVGDHTYLIHFFDIPGATRFLRHSSFYCSGCAAVLFCYDVTDPASFDVLRDWIAVSTQDRNNRSLVGVLVGLKSDSKQRAISAKEAAKLARKYTMKYREASGLTGAGVKELLEFVTSEVASLVPKPVDPLKLSGMQIKICKKMLDDPNFKASLHTAGEEKL